MEVNIKEVEHNVLVAEACLKTIVRRAKSNIIILK